MDKLQKVNKLLELLQNDTLTPKDVEVLLLGVTNLLKVYKKNTEEINTKTVESLENTLLNVEEMLEQHNKTITVIIEGSKDIIDKEFTKKTKENTDINLTEMSKIKSEIESIFNALKQLDFKDGIDGTTPVKGKDYFTKEDKEQLLKDLKPEDITPEKIRDSLETLEGDDRLDAKYIKNIPNQFWGNGGRSISTEGGGSGGLTLTEIEVDLGNVPRSNGRFDITSTGLTVGKAVLISQANGPYTGKGTLADEAEMDGLVLSGKVTSATNIQCFWKSDTRVRSNFKFNYQVSS